MEAVVTAGQVMVQVLITYFLIGFQGNFGMYFVTVYTLAMASTALAVALGCSVEDPKLAQEMLPILFVPQMLFAGFFVQTELIPQVSSMQVDCSDCPLKIAILTLRFGSSVLALGSLSLLTHVRHSHSPRQ